MGSDVASDEVQPPRLQLLVFSGEEIRALDLPAVGTMSIGRGEESAVRIDDLSVSRNHAVLHIGAKLMIEDLGSANGTMVRERAGQGVAGETLNVRHLVGRKAELVVGDTMLFGTASVVVRHAPHADVPDLAPPADGVAAGDLAMRLVHQQAARAAPTPINVLILGETGVGKEVIARAIHAHSPRAKGPFMGINCAALSDSLLESELFGHEKGAFTGALQAREGLFEAAAGGTVFLDEVGELSHGTQAKLLRVLEERVVTRLGANRPKPIDVCILAATNRNLEAEIGRGRFRSDLYFRLNGLSLAIPRCESAGVRSKISRGGFSPPPAA
jgi:transcriptional regulator of acetoin/glycerol metabolism